MVDGAKFHAVPQAGNLINTQAVREVKRYGVRLLCDKENGNGLDLVVEPGAWTMAASNPW